MYGRNVAADSGVVLGNRRKSVADCAVIGFEVRILGGDKVVKINRSNYYLVCIAISY